MLQLPENVSTLEGALIEPLAVGFHTANQGGAHAGQTAVVMGAGCIGLVSMMALKAEGVSRVYVVDVMPKRLEKALEPGADGVINGKDEDVVEAVRKLTGGASCNLVIETAGTEITTRQAIHMAKKGGLVRPSPKQRINQHHENLCPVHFRLTKVNAAKPVLGVSLRSTTICGRAATPPSGLTAKSIPAISTPRPERNVSGCYRR